MHGRNKGLNSDTVMQWRFAAASPTFINPSSVFANPQMTWASAPPANICPTPLNASRDWRTAWCGGLVGYRGLRAQKKSTATVDGCDAKVQVEARLSPDSSNLASLDAEKKATCGEGSNSFDCFRFPVRVFNSEFHKWTCTAEPVISIAGVREVDTLAACSGASAPNTLAGATASGARITEGDSGETKFACVTVQVSPPLPSTSSGLRVSWATEAPEAPQSGGRIPQGAVVSATKCTAADTPAGCDYGVAASGVLTSGTVVFNAGSRIKHVAIPIQGDNTVEDHEVFIFQLAETGLPAGVTLGAASHSITIENDDKAEIRVVDVRAVEEDADGGTSLCSSNQTSSSYTVAGQVEEGKVACVTVQLTSSVNEDVSVGWEVRNVSTTDGDYNLQAARPSVGADIEWAAGATGNELYKTIALPMAANGSPGEADECTENLQIALKPPVTPTSVQLSATQSMASVDIPNGRTVPLANVKLSCLETVIAGRPARCTVSYDESILFDRPIAFSWRTVDQSAIGGVDYTASQGQGSIPARSKSTTISIPTFKTATNNYRFKVQLLSATRAAGGSSGASCVAMSRGEADTTSSVRIIEKPPTIKVVDVRAVEEDADGGTSLCSSNQTSSSYTVAGQVEEGKVACVTVQLTSSVNEDVSVGWEVRNVSTTDGDYNLQAARPSVGADIEWAAGATGNELYKTIALPMAANGSPGEADECTENLQIALKPPVTPTSVQLSATQSMASVDIPNGRTVPLANVKLSCLETVIAGRPARCTVSYDESILFDRPIAFSWRTVDQSAIGGVDYTASQGQGSIPARSKSTTISIPTFKTATNNYRFKVQLLSATRAAGGSSGASCVAMSRGEADTTSSVRIIEKPPTIKVVDVRAVEEDADGGTSLCSSNQTSSSYTVAGQVEEGKVACVTVQLTSSVNEDVSVGWEVRNVSTTDGDYNLQAARPSVGADIEWAAGATGNELYKTIALPMAANGSPGEADECTENLQIALKPPVTPTSVQLSATQSMASVDIPNGRTVPLANVKLSCLETVIAGRPARCTVSYDESILFDRPIAFSWRTVDQSAIGGVDYTASQGQGSIPARSKSTTISIPTFKTATNNYRFKVQLLSATRAAGGSSGASCVAMSRGEADTTSSVRIIEKPPTIKVVDVRAVEEGEVLVRLTVQLSHSYSKAIPLQYRTCSVDDEDLPSGAEQASNNDYVPVPAPSQTSCGRSEGWTGRDFVVPANTLSREVRIVIEDDDILEPDEVFGVEIRLASNAPSGVSFERGSDSSQNTQSRDVVNSKVIKQITIADDDAARMTLALVGYTTASGDCSAAGLPDSVPVCGAASEDKCKIDDTNRDTATVPEGKYACFKASLNKELDQTIKARWDVADGTATDEDYDLPDVATTRLLTFASNVRQQYFSLRISGGNSNECQEHFDVRLTKQLNDLDEIWPSGLVLASDESRARVQIKGEKGLIKVRLACNPWQVARGSVREQCFGTGGYTSLVNRSQCLAGNGHWDADRLGGTCKCLGKKTGDVFYTVHDNTMLDDRYLVYPSSQSCTVVMDMKTGTNAYASGRGFDQPVVVDWEFREGTATRGDFTAQRGTGTIAVGQSAVSIPIALTPGAVPGEYFYVDLIRAYRANDVPSDDSDSACVTLDKTSLTSPPVPQFTTAWAATNCSGSSPGQITAVATSATNHKQPLCIAPPPP